MEETKDPKERLQWHPAFYAGLQIELKDEADRLIFENEHQLGTKPKEIDVLIIKKEPNYPVKKNIGRIFKTWNIIEYKSPTDYLSIDDFYRVYGYACFYKADTGGSDSIPMEELTISFVCKQYPRKLARHLLENRGYTICEQEAGIYYINGDIILIQLIITAELSETENLWLKSLTNDLKQKAETEWLVSEYQKHKNHILYESVMDIIVRANRNQFEEENTMCAALEELFEEMMQDKMNQLMRDRLDELMQDRLDELMQDRLDELMQDRLEAVKQEAQKLHLISFIQRKIKKNKPLSLIAEELEEEPDSIRNIYNMAMAYPNAETEEIYRLLDTNTK